MQVHEYCYVIIFAAIAIAAAIGIRKERKEKVEKL